MSDNTRIPTPPSSIPIPIARGGGHRNRSISLSSSTSSMSSASDATLPQTPPPTSSLPPFSTAKINTSPTSHSPILSYFLGAGQSPTKSTSPIATTTASSAGTFPFRSRGFSGAPPVFEEPEDALREIPVAAHARRASVTVAHRFSGGAPPIPDALHDRGAGLLRRLSLSAGAAPPVSFGKPPSPPPNTAVNTHGPSMPSVPTSKARRSGRSATVSESRPRRAPSPMGERILKGHFDGFN